MKFSIYPWFRLLFTKDHMQESGGDQAYIYSALSDCYKFLSTHVPLRPKELCPSWNNFRIINHIPLHLWSTASSWLGWWHFMSCLEKSYYCWFGLDDKCFNSIWSKKQKTFFWETLSPFLLVRDFGKQNTRGNVSKISFSLACYWQIGSKSSSCSH